MVLCLTLHQTTQLQRPAARVQKTQAGCHHVPLPAAAAVSRHQARSAVAVAVAPPGGGAACATAPAAAVDVRSFLASLPTLPEPGTPDHEFSSESFLERYEMSEVLGEGTFGSVRRCTDSATGQPYAVKVIPKRSPDGKDRSAFIAREVHMWRMLAVLSPRVVGLHAAYQDSNNIFLVQELLLDDLQKVLDEQVVLTEREAATAMHCVLEALASLHAADVVFGDVKPSNFALTKPFPSIFHQIDSSRPKGVIDVKMIDFGTAQLCKDGSSVAEGISGTPVFLAPEVTIKHRCSISMDVWAAGAMLYLMLTGQYPLWNVPAKDFKLTSMKKAVATIQAGVVFWDIPAVQALSPSGRDLLQKMLVADPAHRISIHEALQHPWLQEQLGPQQQ